MDTASHGVGSTLVLLYGLLGHHFEESCSCEIMADRMDENGPQWCRDNFRDLVQATREVAEYRGVWYYCDQAAATLLWFAIWYTEIRECFSGGRT